MFPEGQEDVLKHIVLSTTKRYSVYHEVKQKIFTFKTLESENLDFFHNEMTQTEQSLSEKMVITL